LPLWEISVFDSSVQGWAIGGVLNTWIVFFSEQHVKKAPVSQLKARCLINACSVPRLSS